MNINGLAEYYICVKITNSRTAANYQDIARRFSECCEHTSIEDIDHLSIKNWKDSVLKTASPTSWNTYLRHIKALFNFAHKKELISHNPFEEISFAPKIIRCKKTIQNGTVMDIIQAIQDEPERYKPDWFWLIVTRFLYLTGIRRRQLISITWEHIDFVNKTLLICAEGSKNYKERKLPLAQSLINDLQFLLNKHKAIRKGRTIQLDQVFNIIRFNDKYHGTTTKVDQISGFYKRLAKTTGITVSPHRFRHTMATELGNDPHTNILTLSNILGHSDLRITRQYVEVALDPQRILVEKLDNNLTITYK